MALKDLVRPGRPPGLRLKPAKVGDSIGPIHINQLAWLYAEAKGLVFVHEIRDGDRFIRTDQIVIKWRDIERALAERPPQPKARGGYRHGVRRTTAGSSS
jgi:hypothetical protein